MMQRAAAADKSIAGPWVKVVNFILFQAVWLVTVVGAARGLTWPALAAIGVFAAIHSLLVPRPKADFVLLAIAVVAGMVCDTLLVQSGLMRVATPFPVPGFAPLWMLVLWANLALAVNHCLGWLHGHGWLAAGAGAVGGPLAYIGGAKLGAADLGASLWVVAAPVAVVWSIVTPLLFRLAAHLTTRFDAAQ